MPIFVVAVIYIFAKMFWVKKFETKLKIYNLSNTNNIKPYLNLINDVNKIHSSPMIMKITSDKLWEQAKKHFAHNVNYAANVFEQLLPGVGFSLVLELTKLLQSQYQNRLGAKSFQLIDSTYGNKFRSEFRELLNETAAIIFENEGMPMFPPVPEMDFICKQQYYSLPTYLRRKHRQYARRSSALVRCTCATLG